MYLIENFQKVLYCSQLILTELFVSRRMKLNRVYLAATFQNWRITLEIPGTSSFLLITQIFYKVQNSPCYFPKLTVNPIIFSNRGALRFLKPQTGPLTFNSNSKHQIHFWKPSQTKPRSNLGCHHHQSIIQTTKSRIHQDCLWIGKWWNGFS